MEKPQPFIVSAFDWVVSDLESCGFVCCRQQQTARPHHKLSIWGVETDRWGSGRWTTENRKKGLDLRSRMATDIKGEHCLGKDLTPTNGEELKDHGIAACGEQRG